MPPTAPRAAVAAGSRAAADAAATLLRAGGNAVDAALAAAFAGPVCEPVLSSLGGGGFLLHRAPDGSTAVLDFFTDVPGRDGPGQPAPRVDEYQVRFPSAEQVFRVGPGTVAVPGCLSGYLAAHRRWGRLPLADVLAPARALATDGTVVEPLQVDFATLLAGSLGATPEGAALFLLNGAPKPAGALHRDPAYAALLADLATGRVTGLAGPYADALLDAAGLPAGGRLTRADLAGYTVAERAPLSTTYEGWSVATNPPPAYGGAIVADALGILAADPAHRLDPASWSAQATAVRTATEHHRRARQVARGTTHVSVVDADGGAVALTVSNGTGSGVLAGGVLLNNMLGEDDLDPDGTPTAVRLSSMMAPTVLTDPDGGVVVLGSGGSERIRSALVAVVVNLVDRGLGLAEAVTAPRVHAAADGVQAEPGLAPAVLADLARLGPVTAWAAPDLYFGGVHAVRRHADGRLEAAGDPRRGGAVTLVR